MFFLKPLQLQTFSIVNMPDIILRSTSRTTAVAEPIVLRSGSLVRLVFIPTIVDNINNPDASIQGRFIYQKKSKSAEWEDIKEETLKSLKQGEGYQLEIHANELFELLSKLRPLWKTHRQNGIPRGRVRFIEASESLLKLQNIAEGDLNDFLQENQLTGISLFKRLATWISKLSDTNQLLSNLESLDADNIKQLNIIASLGSLHRSIGVWESNKSNNNEEFWQQELLKDTFLLTQLFTYPVVLVKQKAYVGGKTYDNSNGKIVDFLLKNEITNNAALIEIKAPTTFLMGKEYRQIYSASADISGSIVQVADYVDTINKSYYALTSGENGVFDTFKPRAVIIAGNASEEFKDNPVKRKSFELYRNSLKDVEIITFDELFGKISSLILLLEQGNGSL